MVITDKDIKKLSDVFATKDDLKRFATKDDLAGLRGEIMGGLDRISGDLEKMREDRIFAQGKDREQGGRLDNLEGRMQKVEAKIG